MDPPSVALNDVFVGFRLRVGVGADVTVNSTSIVCGEFVAFESATVIVAV